MLIPAACYLLAPLRCPPGAQPACATSQQDVLLHLSTSFRTLVPTPVHPWVPPSTLALPFAAPRHRCPPITSHTSASRAGPSCSVPVRAGQAPKHPHHGLGGHQHPATGAWGGDEANSQMFPTQQLCSQAAAALQRGPHPSQRELSSQVQEGFAHLSQTINYHVCQDKQPALIIILLNIEQRMRLS